MNREPKRMVHLSAWGLVAAIMALAYVWSLAVGA